MNKKNLIIANKIIAFQNEEKAIQAAELVIANEEIVHQNQEMEKCVDQLGIANNEIALQKERCTDELIVVNKELAFENSEKKMLAAELDTAHKEIAFQNEEIRLSEEQIHFNRHNLDALINSTYDLLWSVDTNFRLITSNKAFDEAMVLMTGSVIDKGATILNIGFPNEQLEKYKVFYQRAFSGEVFTEYDHANIPTNTWSEISFYPIRNGDAVVGTACYSRDITSRKNAELDLIRRNGELEEFADMVSHELRGPVASILGATAMFNNPELNHKERVILADGINNCAMKLDSVVHDLNEILQTK